MAEQKKTKMATATGDMVEGIEVPINESNEKWSELKLGDGTVLRVKMSVSQILRIEGQYDALGNPIYVMNATPTIAVISVQDEHKKPK